MGDPLLSESTAWRVSGRVFPRPATADQGAELFGGVLFPCFK